MNVCILSKYPPIEGGISSRSYWLARAYADAGVNVHVVTNGNTVEDDYKIEGCYPHINELKGVTLHEVGDKLPWHIPDEPHSLAKLIDKTLEITDSYSIDIIDTGYIVPYGIAGYFIHQITDIPYIIRHGGSDIEKFIKQGAFNNIIGRVLTNSAAIITDTFNKSFFSKYSDIIEILPQYVPNANIFQPINKEHATPHYIYIGKINWHWQRKGLDKIFNYFNLLPDNCQVDIVAQGKGDERLHEYLCSKQIMAPAIRRFIPPWQMPQLLQINDYVFCLSVDDPVVSFSNLLIESVFSGATPIIGMEYDISHYKQIIDNIEDHVLRVPLSDPVLAVDLMRNRFNNLRTRSYLATDYAEVFSNYVEENIILLEKYSQRI